MYNIQIKKISIKEIKGIVNIFTISNTAIIGLLPLWGSNWASRSRKSCSKRPLVCWEKKFNNLLLPESNKLKFLLLPDTILFEYAIEVESNSSAKLSVSNHSPFLLPVESHSDHIRLLLHR